MEFPRLVRRKVMMLFVPLLDEREAGGEEIK